MYTCNYYNMHTFDIRTYICSYIDMYVLCSYIAINDFINFQTKKKLVFKNSFSDKTNHLIICICYRYNKFVCSLPRKLSKIKD